MIKKLALIAATSLIFAGCTTNPSMSEGKVLTDNAGMTLYTFDKDSADKSNCYGECAKKWPIFYGTIDKVNLPTNINMNNFATITRKDGILQTTYNHKPLYYFFKDAKPGDRNGDGKKGVWHIVK